MMSKFSIIAILILLVLSTGCDLNNNGLGQRPDKLEKDLSQYPFFFFDEEGNFNGLIIVDGNAENADLTNANNLMNSFKKYDAKITPKIIKKYPEEYSNMRESNAVYLGSCNQEPYNRFANIYVDCVSMMKNQVIIRVIKHIDKWLLYVIGYSPEQTANAVEVLSNYKDYNLKGQDVEVVVEGDGFRIGEPR